MTSRRRLILLACTLAVLPFSTGCRTKVVEPSSREPAPTSAVAVSAVGSEHEHRCTLAVWADLTALRARPGMASIKERVLRGLDAATLAMAQSSGLDLEGMSHEARLCELPERGRRGRVLEFRGSYPSDLLDKLSRLFAATPQQDKTGIIRVSSGWLDVSGDRLLWADDRAALEEGLRESIFDPPPREAKLFTMRLNRERVHVRAGGTRHSPLEDASWTSVVVSPTPARARHVCSGSSRSS